MNIAMNSGHCSLAIINLFTQMTSPYFRNFAFEGTSLLDCDVFRTEDCKYCCAVLVDEATVQGLYCTNSKKSVERMQRSHPGFKFTVIKQPTVYLAGILEGVLPSQVVSFGEAMRPRVPDLLPGEVDSRGRNRGIKGRALKRRHVELENALDT